MTDDFNNNLPPYTDIKTNTENTEIDLSLASLREKTIQQIRCNLRPGQQQMADWQGGPLAVSAVPGAGKSYGMAAAAALAIARYQLHSNRQLIVVTFTRSAASNIKTKIRKHLKELSLPQGSFIVHTLHGLALSIALRHPELSELDLENTTLILPTPSNRITRTCVENWIANNPRHYQLLIEGVQFDGEETERLRRQSVLRTEVLPQLAWKAIQQAKSSGLKPEYLWQLRDKINDHYQVVTIAANLYQIYQEILRENQLIDYDEMILAALRVLENEGARKMWQNQVFAVFEDEAQDSTPLQTKLLKKLAYSSENDDGNSENNGIYQEQRLSKLNHLNLMRVGDPNQAINSTFTPADPIDFRQFCEDCEQLNKLATMEQAGRSCQKIIDAANFVLKWVNNSELTGIEKPFRDQNIHPANDNPPATDGGLEIYEPRDIYQTLELMGKRIINLFKENPDGNFAVLVRENKQGKFITDTFSNPGKYGIDIDLGKQNISIYDVSQGARYSQIPAEILALMQFIDRPHSPDYLKSALKVLGDRRLIPKQDYNTFASVPEQFLYPGPLDPYQSEKVRKCRDFCRSLLRAKSELPLYQLISFLALALKYQQSDLATADKLAERVAKQTFDNSSMNSILEVLSEIVGSERFEPVEVDEDAEKSYTRPQQLTIITMHKAKGLDWDYVFLPFLHENIIPGNLRVLPQVSFLGEFDLAEVARAQIRASLQGQDLPDISTAWKQAGYLKTAEEFRLLYVAMTRAKRLLWMSAAKLAPFTWNKPDNLQEQKPCPVLPVLKAEFPDSFR
ncbi:MAG: ATP-dependent helicase [Okeania sp. SIO2G4]|uniref:ATP-dependent helicase n=1 Tax=unclassified Okeania TaxID=2634635 RepID=UPI0013B65CCC|nr:ATP-dependent helicase [Okeania sp. SIO2G5]NEP96153.1 ATP-dependent helicase [Okeania sp. SIO2F5]NEQ94157.1 ATP-dependent helicase [Okeania sp. SIO2G4]